MTKLDPFSDFWTIYSVWQEQEDNALITSIGAPDEMWYDLEWTRDRSKKALQVDESATSDYFRYIRVGKFPERGTLKAVDSFLRGRIQGIGCIVLLDKYFQMLSLPLPTDSRFDAVEAYRDYLTRAGAFTKVPQLLKKRPLEGIIFTDRVLCLTIEEMRKYFDL